MSLVALSESDWSDRGVSSCVNGAWAARMPADTAEAITASPALRQRVESQARMERG
jgi:hypothetical protein